jgi:hypothetical protein
MRNYWLRIFLGAFAIFIVGMIGVSLVRGGMHRVHEVVEGQGPLTIPLAFVPFNVGGERLGTVQRVVLQRSEPGRVGSVEVHIDLGDSLVAQGLSGCLLAANFQGGPEEKGVNVQVGRDSTGPFACLAPDSIPEDMTEFGEAILQPGDVTVPLYLHDDLVTELEEGFTHDTATTVVNADSISAEARREVDAALTKAGMSADSIGRMGRRLGDSLRKAGLARRDSLAQLDRMADSLDRP